MFSRRLFYPRLLAMAGCLLALYPREQSAQVSSPSPFTPYQHRALYLYNFAKFTTWPKDAFPTANSPFVVATLGDDPFGKSLEVIRDKVIQGRKLILKNFRSVDQVSACHILFISESERKTMPEIVKTLAGSPILTVAEEDNFLEIGGMINLLMVNKTLSFEINQAAGEKTRLKFDSRLLRLANRVVH